METEKLKKLVFKKETVASLSNQMQGQVFGGSGNTDCPTECGRNSDPFGSSIKCRSFINGNACDGETRTPTPTCEHNSCVICATINEIGCPSIWPCNSVVFDEQTACIGVK
jgi:hypothetical protein